MALPALFVVKNARIWNSDSVTELSRNQLRDVYVWDSKIFRICNTGPKPIDMGGDWVEFDAAGKVLMPMGVDLQVHLRVPGQSEKETATTGLMAALRGGIAAILSMPNTKPVIDSAEVLNSAQAEVAGAEKQTGVKAYFTGAMTLGQEGRQAVDSAALKAGGVLALTDDGKGVARDEVMLEVLKVGAKVGLPLLQHAETPGHGGILSPCATQKKLGLPAYPDRAETDMVARDLRLLAEVPQARYHVQHVSLIETVNLVKAAQAKGLHATCEVTPHHLLFSADDIPEGNTSYKMNPPLRSRKDQQELIAALEDGRIDFVTTDHAPHEFEKKGSDFLSSAFGTTGLETSLLALFQLVKEGKLSPHRMVEVFSTKPAEWAGLSHRYGRLDVEMPFLAVWFDDAAPASEMTLKNLESKSKNNIFLGHKLPGKILGVWNEAGFFKFV
jgi:dihydroorotase